MIKIRLKMYRHTNININRTSKQNINKPHHKTKMQDKRQDGLNKKAKQNYK